ncbi:MAG TPA: nucleoside transporter C-terminal domain-containing protein [Sedimentisphaerales bacterium]|nr:nucleoside transporter C-terminal domain-containing protein [Sedimentisphaerales bacterium]
MERVISLFGLVIMMFLAWLLSAKRKRMNARLILSGVALQFILAAIILWTAPGRFMFSYARTLVTQVVEFSNQGAQFVFGKELVLGTDLSAPVFAFSVLPTIIFVSSLMAVLFHLGILQKVVEFMAKIMVYVMDVSGSESLATAANVFLGMAEAPLVIKPYMKTMTRSELMAMMTGGMATISGALLATYASFGADAGHLLTASIISAPAALVIAKIMIPEADESLTKGVVKVQIPKEDANVLDAACRGASEGGKLALNIAAMLICFIAFVALLNWLLSLLPGVAGEPLTLERMLGWLAAPLAWVMGIEWKDATTVGMLLGKKVVLNEFLAYLDLVKYKDAITERSFTIATYALCGFANFGSIAIQIGGYGSLVPTRRKDFAKLGFRAMIGGSLAAFMTATIAGILI